MKIFSFLSSAMTENWISLGCGQNNLRTSSQTLINILHLQHFMLVDEVKVVCFSWKTNWLQDHQNCVSVIWTGVYAGTRVIHVIHLHPGSDTRLWSLTRFNWIRLQKGLRSVCAIICPAGWRSFPLKSLLKNLIVPLISLVSWSPPWHTHTHTHTHTH